MLFKLLLIDMYQNCITTGFEVRACTVSSPHIRKKFSFKLICVIRIFMRNILVVQCHPRIIKQGMCWPQAGAPGFLKLFLCRHLYVFVCVCVSPPLRLLKASGMMWHDMDLIQLVKQVIQLLYGNCNRYC